MSGLRFAFVTTFYPPHNFGGDGIGVQRWARALVRRGHRVDVICDTDVFHLLRNGPAPERVEEEPGITVHRLRTGIGPLSVLLTQQLGRPVVNGARIRSILERGRFDVINYHNVSAIGGPGVLAAGNAIKLYTAWEHWLVCPMHVLWRHNREACTGRQCVRCTLAYRRPPQLWRYSDLMARHLDRVDAFIALSRFSRDKHHEFGFPREMEVLPGFLPDPDPADVARSRRRLAAAEAEAAELSAERSGAPRVSLAGAATAWGPPPEFHDGAGSSVFHHRSDASRIEPSLPEAGAESSGGGDVSPGAGETGDSPHPRPYFLFVGRLERIKGLDDVIPVFERYTDADLVVIGDGNHRAALERIAAGNPRVRFLGALPQEQLARWNAHAIASLVTTAGFETFGFVVIEAFGRGTPVVCRRIGPLPELVQQCGGGETFASADELPDIFRRLQHIPARRAQLARAAFEGFVTNWTESAVLPRYVALLERVARARGDENILRALDAGRAA